MSKLSKNSKAFYNTEIPSDWEDLNIGDLIKFSGGSQPPQKVFISEEKEGYVRLIQTRDYRTNNYRTFIPIELARKFCDENDIMIGRYGPPVFQVFKGLKGAYNVALIKATPCKKIDPLYCYFILLRPELRFYIESLSQRSGGQTGVDIDKLNEYPLPLPTLHEQKAIVQVLSTADIAIHTTEKLIAQKELRKKWLMQQLLTGKKRLKEFGDFNYKKVTLDEILNPIRKPLIPEEKTFYQQIGIRSHGKGIFYKEKISGKSLGDKRVFWIEPNCLVLNIVFAWEQAIAKTTEFEIGMIASHRFPMFRPIEGKLNLDYILYYFKSPRGKQLLENASPGGAGRNKTLGQSEFINQIIPLPSFEEQTAIAQVLQAADKEISLLKSKAEKLREQKKGLMQQLLTGKVRLKIN